ncbi:MAG: ATP-binding cassette domain-containing protein [Acidimicrobiia bacterium]
MARATAAATAAVLCRGAGKRFGSTWVVRGLDLQLEPGTILGLIGPSGCGKTTTMRLINGAYHPDEGDVAVFGAPPSRLDTARRVSIGYLPQRPVLFEDLSLWQNLLFHASLNGVRRRGRRARLLRQLELVDLGEDRRKLVRNSSGGMQRRLALAATLAHRPPLLLLDEPTAGIDPILRQRFWDHFRALRDEGHTLVVTTQYVGEAARCDVVGLLAEGAMVAYGTPSALHRAAYGGERIEVETDRLPTEEAVDELRRLDGVRSADVVSDRRLRLVVDDAGAALPQVVQHLQVRGLHAVDAGEVAVDYDDVFIRLVTRARA